MVGPGPCEIFWLENRSVPFPATWIDMVKTQAAWACLFLMCLFMPLQTLLAEEAVAEKSGATGAASADAEISAKLKQSEDEITRLKNELKGLKTKESSFAEQSAKLSSQLDDAKKQAETAATQAEQAKQAKEKAEKELAKCIVQIYYNFHLGFHLRFGNRSIKFLCIVFCSEK
jgi:septal ring factor EnvC (AmiA/AmiB activator)